MKRFNFFLVGISIGLLASCGQPAKEAGNRRTVKVDTVLAAGGQHVLQFPGKVKASQDVNLAFRVSGTIRRVYVNDGARVAEGQLLAELDPADYQAQFDATEAEYRQVKAEAERVMALYKENGTTPNANDKAVFGLKQVTAKYKHHKDQLAYTRLYAPFGGYVQKRLFDAHETVGAGMPVLSMVSAGAPEVEINLPAAEYIRRDRFADYRCTFDVYPEKEYSLKFLGVTPKANANQLYTMRLQVPADGLPVPSPGMNAMVTIRCNDAGESLLSVPGGAVRQQDGKVQVFVYNPADGKVHGRDVTVVRLLSDGSSVIASDEVKPGDLVVSSGVHHVEDGMAVKCLPAVAPTNVGGLL